MLPIEELDKKNYSEILEESILNIPRFTKEWTDLREHDPGITILEMLTWLTDMQRYYLNRITDKNRLKYLKLYGIDLKPQSKSETYVQFECTDKEDVILPKGTKLKADEQVFEITNSMTVTNNFIKKVITATEFLETDNTHVILNPNVTFYPFDKSFRKDNKLYISFERNLPTNETVNIFFDIYDDYPVKINPYDELEYHIDFEWMYYSEDGRWEKIEIIKDDTQYFTKSGNISFKTDKKLMAYDFFNDSCESFWICIRVKLPGINLSPQVRTISLNKIPAINRNTLIKSEDFKRKEENIFYDKIFYDGDIIVQGKTEFGFVDLDENSYSVKKNKKNKSIYISNICEEFKNLRIIGYCNDFLYKREIGKSNGLSYQQFYYPINNAVPEELILQVGTIQNKILYWNDYTYVRSFSESAEKKRIFELDFKNMLIVFGDNENSIIPEKSSNDLQVIRIVSLVYSDKERGNIKSNEIREFVSKIDDCANIRIKYSDKATGGREAMNIKSGERELMKEKSDIFRAVNLSDYEKIAKSTPGFRISHAKAVLDKNEENKIKIILVPYTGENLSVPDEKMLCIVKKYLDKFRLITTKIDIVPPKYVGITVRAGISASAANKFDSTALNEKLRRFLTPIDKDNLNFDYSIGKKIYLSEIIEIISSFKNVSYIDYIRADAKGEGVRIDKEGNIILPYNGICYAKSIEINIY